MGGPRKNVEADGWKGGNTTRGPDRKGWRGGRRSLDPPGTIKWAVATKLSDPLYCAALYLGEGSAARGIRRALEHAATLLAHLPRGTDRFGVEQYVKTHRVAARADISQSLKIVLRPLRHSGTNRIPVAATVGASPPHAPPRNNALPPEPPNTIPDLDDDGWDDLPAFVRLQAE